VLDGVRSPVTFMISLPYCSVPSWSKVAKLVPA